MGVISNGTTLLDAGALDSGIATGAMTLIKTLTASSSATLDFLNGTSSVVFDDTYDSYVFKFFDIHPATDDTDLTFQVDTGTNTNFNITVTSSKFKAYHKEDGSASALGYDGSYDQAEGTGFQNLGTDLIDDNDSSASGKLLLFNPASTTFVKHFLATVNGMTDGSPPYTEVRYSAGYFNTTTALTRVQFKMDSGNIDVGDICLYGIS